MYLIFNVMSKMVGLVYPSPWGVPFLQEEGALWCLTVPFQGASPKYILLQGPDPANFLVVVLTCSQHGEFATTAETEAMFHHVRVPDEDTNLLRFFGGLREIQQKALKSARWLYICLVACPHPAVQHLD